ncbi:MAG: metal-sensitive transcriptional regulator [Chloroflexi bacterium]|nr:metal-sensitive transcriptional regulator [Chloroflexota bacterium]
MNEITRQDVLRRLKSIEGHVRGVQRMVEEDRYCVDIIKQTLAVQAAIDRVNAAVLANHLECCVTAAIRGADSDERERVIAELLDLFPGAASRVRTPPASPGDSGG